MPTIKSCTSVKLLLATLTLLSPAVASSGNESPPPQNNSTDATKGTADGSAPKEKSPDMSRYMSGVRKKMQRVWHSPDVPERRTVSILFTLDKDGAVISAKVNKSSGLANVDQQALTAVKKASPFDKLPEGAGKFSIDYSFECGPHKSADSFMFNGVPIKNQEYKISSGGATLHNLSTDSAAERKLQERAYALQDKADQLQARLTEFKSAATPDQTKMTTTLRDLANTYKQLQQYDKAEPLYKDLIATAENAAQESSLISALSDFANMYYTTNRYGDAEPLYARAVSLQNKIDATHADKTMLNDYAKTLYKLNKTSQADEIYKQLRQMQ